jgi:hypothetical protein
MNMMTQSLLHELEFEIPATRRTLERVPEKLDWAPHTKSMTLGKELALQWVIGPNWG